MLLGEELVADQLPELERRAGRRDADDDEHGPFERVGSNFFLASRRAHSDGRAEGRVALVLRASHTQIIDLSLFQLQSPFYRSREARRTQPKLSCVTKQ